MTVSDKDVLGPIERRIQLERKASADFFDASMEWRRLFSEGWGTFLLVVVAAGRLCGRYLRRPGPSVLPGRLGAWCAARRALWAPHSLELTLGRDSVADPYEVTKLMDGLAGVLRPRLRHPGRLWLGPQTVSLWISHEEASRTKRSRPRRRRCWNTSTGRLPPAICAVAAGRRCRSR